MITLYILNDIRRRILFRESIRTVNLYIRRALPTKITFEHNAL
jgi:hypothetical protein